MMQNSPALHTTPGHSTGTPTGSFAIDSFDFGSSDFSLPTSLDDLPIFTNHPANSYAGSDGSSSAHASHHPSPSNLTRSDILPSSHLQSNHTSSPLSLARNNHLEKSASPQSAAGNSATDNRPRQNSSGADTSFNGYLHQQQQQQHHMHHAHPHPQQQQPGGHDQQQQHQQGMVPQLSIADLQRMLLEKERSERIQNMQTAMLKQQLEQLRRMQPAHQQQQPQQLHNVAQMGQSVLANLGGADVSQNLQQQLSFLAALQSVLNGGGGGGSGVSNQPQQQNAGGSVVRQDQLQINGHQWHAPNGGGVPISGSGSNDDPSALAQYGLMTPLGSSAFSNSSCPPGSASFMSPLNMSIGSQQVPAHPIMSQFTPVESPAATPASVFSNASTGIVMSELFSPLTSPALGPQPPSLGEILLPPAHMGHPVHQQVQHHHQHQPHQHQHQHQGSSVNASPAFGAIAGNTPIASPLALMGKSGSKNRKNRSTTAEARANKVRPSPLIKPTQSGSSAGSGNRKKRDSTAGNSATAGHALANGSVVSVPSSRRTSVSESDSRDHSRHHSIEAHQSEGTSSTPSPIDLGGGSMPPPPPPPSKPMTPGSIMGIRPLESKRSSLQNLAPSPASRTSGAGAAASSVIKGKAKAEGAEQPAQPQQQQYSNIAPFASGPQSAPKVTFDLANANGSGEGSRSGGSSNAGSSSGNLQQILPNGGLPIQPSGLSQAERDAWTSYKSAGGLESRRTSHKAAEQKRRDSLKFCFDELRGLLPAITLDEDVPAGSLLGPDGAPEDQTAEQFDVADVRDAETARSANKAISKVALLRHSNEYLIRLSRRLSRRDEALAVCRKEIADLRQQLGLPQPEDSVMTGNGVAWVGAMAQGQGQGQGAEGGKFEAEGQEEQQQQQQQQQSMEEDATTIQVAAGMDTS